MLFFPWERSAEVLHAWLEWTTTVPDEVTSVGRILQFPPIAEVPEPFRGGKLRRRRGRRSSATRRTAPSCCAPLRELGPAIDTFAMVPPVGISELHMDPPTPMPYAGGGTCCSAELTAGGDRRLRRRRRPRLRLAARLAEIRHIGGALSPRARPATARSRPLAGEYLTFGVGMVFDAARRGASPRRLAMIEEALEPVDTGRKYLNFTEEPTDPARFFDAGDVRPPPQR